jgi:hypothetical protein
MKFQKKVQKVPVNVPAKVTKISRKNLYELASLTLQKVEKNSHGQTHRLSLCRQKSFLKETSNKSFIMIIVPSRTWRHLQEALRGFHASHIPKFSKVRTSSFSLLLLIDFPALFVVSIGMTFF